MSRSGYTDDCDGWDLIRWRGAVASAIRGKRGQSFLKEMLTSIDALPEKVLIEKDLQNAEGDVCALGSVGLSRRIDMSSVDPDDRESVAEAFGISIALASEIMYENDEGAWRETPQQRWQRMRNWIVSHIEDSKGAR